MRLIDRLRTWARAIRRDAMALWFAARDPRVPWYAKLMAAGIAAYALSPVDLIPDFIPVLGYLDDLIIVPVGIIMVIRLIPVDVMSDLRRVADAAISDPRAGRAGRIAAGLIVVVWSGAIVCAIVAIAQA